MLFRRNKFRFVHQLESNDCGPACLAMVASYFGHRISVRTIRRYCEVTRMGVSVHDIVSGATKMGFEATALKLELKDLEEIPLPSILFWKQDHFVVLRKIIHKKGRMSFELADPGYGELVVDQEIMQKEWLSNSPKGVAVVLELNQPLLTNPESEKGQKQDFAFLQPLWNYLKARRTTYLASGILLIIGMIAGWIMPWLFQKIIDDGIMPGSKSIVAALLLAQLGLFIGSFLSDFASHWLLTKSNFRLSILLKNSFLHKLLKLPGGYFDTRLNTDTLQRLGDQDKIQSFVTWKGMELLLNILNLMVFSILLLLASKSIFLIYISASAASLAWAGLFLRKRKTLEYALFLRQSENENGLYEFIMHMPEIKINHAQKNFIQRLLRMQEKLNHIELRSLFLNIYQLAGVSFLLKLKEISAIAFCAFLIIRSEMTLGALLSISYILGQLSGPVQNLLGYIRDAQDAGIAKDRIGEVYLEKEEKEGKEILLSGAVSRIQFRNVDFKYPGSFNPFILHDISLEIPVNKITAIVGPSGSGKTTLLKLLLSYYPVTTGKISINGHNMNHVDADDWRSRCGTVLQDGHIFSGTITDNIALADPEPNMEKIRESIRIACLEQFIEELPMGLNTKVGQTGMQLSGGQKQRLLIARAVYKDPEFIFLDEATSSLDANNEKEIMNNLNEFFKNRTVVVIAHRLSTVRGADQILVLNKGRLVEQGDHGGLTIARGTYFHLVKNQLELGN